MEDRLTTTTTTTTIRPTYDRPEDEPLPPPTSPPMGLIILFFFDHIKMIYFVEVCRGDGCRPPPNLVGPIVGSLCGILAVALIAVFIIWFYLRRKNKKTKELPSTPSIHYVEQPPLYTGAISTTDSSSRFYGTSPSRNDSIDSHLYEKINYGEHS